MKKFITGIVVGIVLSCSAAFAMSYMAEPNTYPIHLNGRSIEMEGYNINGYTYFKLRDISNAVGGFGVDFRNDTILLSKNGYIYPTQAPNVTYFEYSPFAPDYGAYVGDECIEWLENNDMSILYGSKYGMFITYMYPNNIEHLNKYIQLLQSLGFKKGTIIWEDGSVSTGYMKDGNYITLGNDEYQNYISASPGTLGAGNIFIED